MPNTLGSETTSIFLKGPDNHQLFQDFEVDADGAIKKGQLLKLTATGTAIKLSAAESSEVIIGVAMMDTAVGDMVTVCTKAMTIVAAEANAALNPGPVEYVGQHNDKNLVATATSAAKTIGWSLEVATTQYDEVMLMIAQ